MTEDGKTGKSSNPFSHPNAVGLYGIRVGYFFLMCCNGYAEDQSLEIRRIACHFKKTRKDSFDKL